MAIDNVTSMPTPHGSVQCDAYFFRHEVQIEYIGLPEALIAAGLATVDMLQRGRPGKRRWDQAGDHCHVEYRKDWVRLRLYKREAVARQLPGVARLLDDDIAAERDRQPTPVLDQRRSHLRLVIDNTRPG